MSHVAIRVEGLGKRYQVGGRAIRGLLGDSLMRAATAPARWLRGRGGAGGPGPRAGEFWALRDVSFEIGHGEVVGVIGRNGSGKTTLLKILSRITEPTEGGGEIHGRVGSLLEVGTGFHPELTGRDNVYLNGAIIGMRKREIDRKFDEIVAFAEVEKFVDTPVKHYSSGMYVRLAFAVAAHLEPDILLVDEVLAVGDFRFQRKCLGKMDEAARDGRTVVFVSHQLNQVRRLCQKAFWLDAGRLREIGDTAAVVSRYESGEVENAGDVTTTDRCFRGWRLMEGGHEIRDDSSPVVLRVTAYLDRPVSGAHFGCVIVSDTGLIMTGWAFEGLSMERGLTELSLEVPSLPLRPGSYALRCSLFDRGNNLTGGDLIEIWHAVPRLSVATTPVGHPQDEWAGMLNLPGKLSMRVADDVLG